MEDHTLMYINLHRKKKNEKCIFSANKVSSTKLDDKVSSTKLDDKVSSTKLYDKTIDEPVVVGNKLYTYEHSGNVVVYNILDNGWDEFIFYCPTEYETCTTDVETVSSDTIRMSKIAGYVSPYNAHQTVGTTISSYGEIYVKITKKYTNNEIEEINNEIGEIYKEYNLEEKTTEEKIKTFHDYLIKNTTYDGVFAKEGKSEHQASKANGALLEHYAVCGGYADAMAIFLDYINVPNLIITNDNHAWNLVYINNKWLHIDSTWNDAEIERFNYEFYLINTQELLEIDTTQHTFDTNFFIEAK